MTEHTYTQCLMERAGINYTAWIPSEFAKIGKIVDLEMETGVWEKGWVVEAAYNNSIRTHTQVVARSQDYKKTRKASDI